MRKSLANINLSIIIPHFNASNMLETLLASIPQDKEIQTIVVDDKSEDVHVHAIEELKSKYDFEFYQNDRIKSAGTCRNIGLEHAKGKWVLFADSDDYFVDGFYNAVSSYFESQTDVVFFLPTSLYIDTGEVADRHVAFEKKIKSYTNNKNKENELYVRYMIPNPICKMIKKELIDTHNIKFDEVIASNDVMFSTKVGHFMKSFEVSSEVVYCVTRNHGSLTANLKEEVFDARLGTTVSYIKFLNEKLNKQELDILKPKSAGYLLQSFSRYGFKKLVFVLGLYKKENIKWFYWEYLSPVLILKKFNDKYNAYRNNNKYNVR